MTREELYKLHEAMCADALGIMRDKNRDYAGEGEQVDPFGNFRRAEQLGITTAHKGMLTRMVDKLARLTTFTQTGSLVVKDEAVYETCRDLLNYCVLFAAMHKADNEKIREIN